MHQTVVSQTDMLFVLWFTYQVANISILGMITSMQGLLVNLTTTFYCILTFSLAFHNQSTEDLNSSRTVTKPGKDSSKGKM